jgi:chromosome partitioning protein
MEKTTALPFIPTAVSGVELVPSGPALSGAAQKFTGVLGADLLSRCLMRTQGDWELFLIDCPPSAGILTASALLVSGYVVIPIEANPLALNGMHQLIETLSSLKREDHGPCILGIIACRANPRLRVYRSVMTNLENVFPGKLAPYIRENVALAEAPSHGCPITLHAPNSIGAQDYRRATQWLLERLN